MTIRITGTEDECAAAVAAMTDGFAVREVSPFYPNRGASVLARLYLDVEPLSPTHRAVDLTTGEGRP